MHPASEDPGRRRARLAIAVAAALVLAAGTAVIATRNPTTEPSREQAAVEAEGDTDGRILRSSAGVRDSLDAAERTHGTSPSSVDSVGDDATVDGTAPTAGPRSGSQGVADPGALATSKDTASAAPGPSGEPAGSPPRTPAPAPAPAASILSKPLYLPGTGDAPVLGPITPGTDEEDDSSLPPMDETEPSEEPITPRYVPEPPDRDEEGCPKLNLFPIGGFAEEAPSSFADLSPSFRAEAPAEWAKEELVCGHALEPWRDMVIQRLVVGGAADGALITAADGSSIVLRVSEIEWTTYRLRYGGGPIGPNLVGFPLGRTEVGGAGVIETTGGGLVFSHPEAMGVPLLGGAWQFWLDEAGPSGRMGLPIGIPESAAGPIGADVWVPGLPSTGARQEFANGWLFLSGVLTDVEAAAQPASRYEWHDTSELGPTPTDPIDYRGHIMQIGGMSFYVDQGGTRHWIPSTSAWSCAHWDLRATEYAVRGFEMAQYPLGSEFVCADYK